MSLSYGAYFDEDYYENGHLKGTAYSNYRNAVQVSRDYAEIAERLTAFFAPRRVLEIGCGMGQIGRHFERLGVEYVGSEVADYCVANRLCAGVFKHDEVKLPFPDGHFDLVFGCHSIEHFPDSIFQASLREHLRVTRSYYGHFLPIVGPSPFFSAEGLKKDPTHYQLHTRKDWIEKILAIDKRLHFLELHLPSRNQELFYGQIWFSLCGAFPAGNSHLEEYRGVCDTLFQQIAEMKAAQAVERATYSAELHRMLFSPVRQGELGPSNEWTEQNFSLEDWAGPDQRLIVATRGLSGDCEFRIALLGENYEADHWIRASADFARSIPLAEFTIRRGGPGALFNRIDIGGPRFPSRMQFVLVAQGGPAGIWPQMRLGPTLKSHLVSLLPSPAKAILRPPYRLSRRVLRRLRNFVEAPE
jgi:SAM-dependent methyltransferase